jgi:GT2 family glycosyltransferase
MSQVDLSVIVVSYNVRAFLDHCLQSVKRASGGLAVQLIVVDNASQDGSAAMVAQRHPEAVLIANGENVGFGRANNQAFEIAQGEAVLILNPDSFIQEDTLTVLLQKLKQFPDVGAIGPRILLPDGRFEPRSMRGFPTPWTAFSYLSGLSALFPKSRLFGRYLLTFLDSETQNEVDSLSGCCLMARRSILQQLGGFDPDYFMYGEDLDLCYRIHRAGYRILYTPETRIVHFKGESTRRSNIDRDFHFQRAMRLFVDKNLSSQASFFARGMISLGFTLRDLEGKLISVLAAIAAPLADVIILNLLIYLGRWVRFGQPEFSPTVWLADGLYSFFYVVAGLALGVYTKRRFSGRFASYAAGIGAVLSSSVTYFFHQWAFSRLVVLWFGIGMILAMPGWRILLRSWLRRKPAGARPRWGQRRALIIGTDELARGISRQFQADPGSEIKPIGYLSFAEERVGSILDGVPVLGTVDELENLIRAERIQEVLFSTAEASYERIIGLIQALSIRPLDFKIIPREHAVGGDEKTLLRLELAESGRDHRWRERRRGFLFKK